MAEWARRSLIAAALLAAWFFGGPQAATAAAPARNPYEWIQALQPIARLDAPVLPEPVLWVAFAPGTAELTAKAKAGLDQLATALASSDLRGFLFALRWQGEGALAERRAEAARGHLVAAGAGIDDERLELVRAGEAPPAGAGEQGPDTLFIEVINMGLAE
jgi:outer membrane protein OmpA-like peptidoglycan-associated protein